jgi:hypothetical protein
LEIWVSILAFNYSFLETTDGDKDPNLIFWSRSRIKS